MEASGVTGIAQAIEVNPSMLNKQTVFVIGAGAGFDVDMPVGNKLATEIAEETNFR